MLFNSDDNNNDRLFGNDTPNNDALDNKPTASEEPKLFSSSHSSSQTVDSSDLDELDKDFESFAISFKANDPTASSVSEKLKSELNDQKFPPVDEFTDDFDDFSDFKIDSNVSAFKPLDKISADDTPSPVSKSSDLGLDFPETVAINTPAAPAPASSNDLFDDEFDSFVPDSTINPFKSAPVFPTVSGKVNSSATSTPKPATPVAKKDPVDPKVAAREKAKADLDFPVEEFKLPADEKKTEKPADDFKPESFGKVSSGVNAFSKKSPFAKSEFSSENNPVARTERKAADKPAEKAPADIPSTEEIVASISAADDPGSISPFKKVEVPKEPEIKPEVKPEVMPEVMPEVIPEVKAEPAAENVPNTDTSTSGISDVSNKPLARPAISKPIPTSAPAKSRPGAVDNTSKVPTKSKAPDIAPITPVAKNKNKKKPAKEEKDPGVKGIIGLIIALALVLIGLVVFENWGKISSAFNKNEPDNTTVIEIEETTEAEATTTAEETTTTAKATTEATTTATTTEATTAATTTEETTEATTEATTTATTTTATTTEATTEATTTATTTEATTTATTTEATTTTTTTEATTTTTTTAATTARATSSGSAPVLTFYQGIKNTSTTDSGFVFDLKLENYGSVDAVLSDSLNTVSVRLSCNSKITNVTSEYFTFTQTNDNTWVGTPKSNISIPAGETFLGTVKVTTESSVTTYSISSYYFDWNT